MRSGKWPIDSVISTGVSHATKHVPPNHLKKSKKTANNLLGANNINESCLLAIFGTRRSKQLKTFIRYVRLSRRYAEHTIHVQLNQCPIGRKCVFSAKYPPRSQDFHGKKVTEHLLPCHLAKRHKYLCQLLCSLVCLPFSCFWGIFRAKVQVFSRKSLCDIQWIYRTVNKIVRIFHFSFAFCDCFARVFFVSFVLRAFVWLYRHPVHFATGERREWKCWRAKVMVLVFRCYTGFRLLNECDFVVVGFEVCFWSPPCIFDGILLFFSLEFMICVAWQKPAGSYTFHLRSVCQTQLLTALFAVGYVANNILINNIICNNKCISVVSYVGHWCFSFRPLSVFFFFSFCCRRQLKRHVHCYIISNTFGFECCVRARLIRIIAQLLMFRWL